MIKLTCKWAGVALLTVPLLMNACVVESSKPNMTTQQNTERKLVAGELIVDAEKGPGIIGVEMFADGMERPFFSNGVTRNGSASKMGFPLPRIPQHVRVIWRQNDDVRITNGKIVYGGPLAGDYTIPVASRIPASVFEEIERNGGALRIKFRLKPDGVMLGWDIMREGKGKYTFDYEMAGGDFREARIYNGKVDRKGWYIDKNGQKIETDY